MASIKVSTTKNYGMFTYDIRNRKFAAKKHRKLEISMKKYGFMACFPIICVRDGRTKKLRVIDGQHRLGFALQIGLPVHYCIVEEGFNIAEINGTSKNWVPEDYAMMYASQGKEAYIKALEFKNMYNLPVGRAFGLLEGCMSWSTVRPRFEAGKFEISDFKFATKVATLYSRIGEMNRKMKTTRMLDACIAACRAEGFDPIRLVNGAEKRRETLVPYATRDAYLCLFEDLYNYNRNKLYPLKINALTAIRERAVA